MNLKLENILSSLKIVKNDKKYSEFEIGVAGSYARGEQTDESDIDIVINTDSLSISDMENLKYLIKNILGVFVDIDILQLPLIKNESDEDDEFCKSMGIPLNNFSVYRSVVREVIWVG